MKKITLWFYKLIGTIDGIRMAFDIKKFYILTMICSGLAVLAATFTFLNDMQWNRFISHGWIFFVVMAGLVVVASIVKAFYDYFESAQTYIIKREKSYKAKVLEKLTLSERMKDDEYRVLKFNNGFFIESYVMSNKCNKALYDNCDKISLEKLNAKFHIVDEIKNYIPFAISALLKNNYVTFNGKTVRLMNEIFSDMKSVHVQQAGYFDGQCTNELTYAKMRNVCAINEVFEGEKLLIDENNTLYEMDDSPCSNYIGVSTLAITKDNCLVILQQGAASNANAKRFAPSGSGSAHISDLKNAKTFGEFLINAMERELCEECNLNRKKYISETKVIGYARLLERGGKPDFFGITTLRLSSQELLEKYNLRMKEQGLMSREIKFRDLKEKVEITQGDIKNICEVSATLEKFFSDNPPKDSPKISIQLHIFNEIINPSPVRVTLTKIKRTGNP